MTQSNPDKGFDADLSFDEHLADRRTPMSITFNPSKYELLTIKRIYPEIRRLAETSTESIFWHKTVDPLMKSVLFEESHPCGGSFVRHNAIFHKMIVRQNGYVRIHRVAVARYLEGDKYQIMIVVDFSEGVKNVTERIGSYLLHKEYRVLSSASSKEGIVRFISQYRHNSSIDLVYHQAQKVETYFVSQGGWLLQGYRVILSNGKYYYEEEEGLGFGAPQETFVPDFLKKERKTK